VLGGQQGEKGSFNFARGCSGRGKRTKKRYARILHSRKRTNQRKNGENATNNERRGDREKRKREGKGWVYRPRGQKSGEGKRVTGVK